MDAFYHYTPDLTSENPAQLVLFSFSKICYGCNTEKPHEKFAKNKRRPDGYNNLCKECDNKRHRELRGHNVPVAITSKACKKCKKNRPAECFSANPSKRDGYSGWCKDCVSEYNLKYRAANHESKKKQDLAYYYEHRDKILNDRIAYNADEARQDQFREKRRAYRKANPLKMLEYSRRHIARKYNAAIGEVDYTAILKRDGYWCYICDSAIDPQSNDNLAKLSFDHVIPLARGGAHSESNVKPAHKACNSRKQDRLFEEMTPFQKRGIE